MNKLDENIGIYRIINLVNRKVYIGKSKNLKQRKYTHFHQLRKGIHTNQHLQNSFNKYGEENFIFEVIDNLPRSFSDKETFVIEEYYIKLNKSNDSRFGYNITLPTKQHKTKLKDEFQNKRRKLVDLKKVHREKRGRPIIKMSKDGEFLNIYNSVSSAAEEFVSENTYQQRERYAERIRNSMREHTPTNSYKGYTYRYAA